MADSINKSEVFDDVSPLSAGRAALENKRDQSNGRAVDGAANNDLVALTRTIKRLTLLHQLADNLIRGDKPRQQLNAAFDSVADELGADFYFNYRTDDAHPETLFLESSRGPDPDQVHPLNVVVFGQHLCGRVAKTRQHLIIEDILSRTDDATAEVRAMGIRAYAGTPLIGHGHLHGTICIGSTTQSRFTEFDLTFLRTLANQFAAMLDRTRMLGHLRERDQQMHVAVRTRIDAEKALSQTAELFFTLVDQSPTGMYVVDAQFRLIQINAIALPVFNSIEPLIGRDFSEVVTVLWGAELGRQITSIFRHTLNTGQCYVSPVFTEYRHDLGVEQSYEWQTQRMTLPNGEQGVVCYFQDVTETKRTAVQLGKSQARLRHAADAAQLTYVEIDFARDRLQTAENFAAVMGYPSPRDEAANAAAGSKLLIEHVVPQDRLRVEAALKDFLGGQPSGKIDYRVCGDDQIERSIESRWSTEHALDGTPLRAFATNLDVSERKQVEHKLRVSEIRYRRLFEAALDGVLLLDPETRKITDANPFMTRLLNYSHAELVGQQLFEIGLLKDEAASQEMFQKLKIERHVRYDHLPLESKGGQRQDVEVVANVYDENGHDVIQCNIRDITARAQAQAHTNLLMSEVNHRSKNLLGVVQAVARQTARGGDPASFVARLSNRIDALAAIQDLLVLNEWKGIEVADLIKGQLAHFSDLMGSRILLDGPKMGMIPAAAQGIGMALHELATNAAKYGALSNNEGRVHISWQVTKTRHPEFLMTWMEDGGPTVAAPANSGFGQMIIGKMASAAVGGSAQIDYRHSGLTWKLRAPVKNMLETGVAARTRRAY